MTEAQRGKAGRRKMLAGVARAIVVPVAIVLHAAAELGEPGCVGDTQQDALLLGLGDDVGDESGPLVEDAHHDVLPS